MRFLRLLFIAIVALYLLTGVVQVKQNERAVVRRFGRILDHKPEPGLWIGLPWGMDRVDRVEVSTVRSVEVGYKDDLVLSETTMPAGQMLTGDHNLVNAKVVLLYKVRADEVDEFVVQGERVQALLTRAVEAAVGNWISGRGVDEVLLRGKTTMRSELLSQVREFIEPYRLGVDVLDARVAKIAPPDEVKDAFDRVSRAQTEMSTLRYRAEQEAESRGRLARAEADRIEQQSRAYGHGKTLIARQEARRFLGRLAQYQTARATNPSYLRQIWQEERGKLFAKLKENGQIDLLDHQLNSGGIDIFTAPRTP